MKKNFFYLSLIVFNLILIEVISSFAIKKIIFKYQDKISFKEQTNQLKKKVVDKNKEKYIPYLRDKNQYNGKSYIKLEKESDFIFNEIAPFNDKNKFNILIQGDSYGESLNQVEIHEIFSNKFNNKNVGLINSSISSYSITPHIFQLDVLLNQFLIKPEILVLIYDQTDIGDDLYRYNIFLNDNQFKKFELYDNKVIEVLREDNLNTLKLVLFLKNYFLKEKNRYQYSNLKTFKNLMRRFYLNNFQNLPVALTPLKYGISIDEENMLITLMDNYIKKAFSNKNLKKIYFVVHPHYNHLDNVYILDNRKILKTSIQKSLYKEQIEIIDFFGNEKSFYQYDEGDIFSHPTREYYMNTFWPKIFRDILDY